MLELIINDEAVTNDRGWRLLNSGLDHARYDKNPLLLHQHDTDQIVGHCTALRIEGTKLIGTFDFDADPDSQAVKEKATNGSLRGVSPGLYIRDMAFAPEGDTVTDWELLEVSLVTLPSNPCAVKLYSQQGTALSDEEATQHIVQLKSNYIMPTPNSNHLTPQTLALLGLGDTATLADIHIAITQLTAERDKLQKALTDLHHEAGQKLIQSAIDAGKIDASRRDSFAQLYATDPELCSSILDAIPAPQSLASRLASKAQPGRYDEDWDTLDRKGLLAQLRADDPDLFAEKFRQRFGN